MKNNGDLQREVENAIQWEPLLNAAEIGVIAKDGVITLSGTVDSYGKKMQAEDATRNVSGVKAIVENIHIEFASRYHQQDSEIAEEILDAYRRV